MTALWDGIFRGKLGIYVTDLSHERLVALAYCRRSRVSRTGAELDGECVIAMCVFHSLLVESLSHLIKCADITRRYYGFTVPIAHSAIPI